MAPSPSTPITIIGAGLSGLALSLCLRAKSIPHRIYDRAHSIRPYIYGITLYKSTYHPLLPILGMDENAFRKEVAVDARLEGRGSMGAVQDEGLRCHRGRLERLLRQDLSISLGKSLSDIDLNTTSKTIAASFDDGSSVKAECVIGCDGPHSTTRQTLSKSMQLTVLPYIAFNGKRTIPKDQCLEWLEKYMEGTCLQFTKKGNCRLTISISDIGEQDAEITYTYSRPARSAGDGTTHDPLHAPDREKAAATQIPEEYFEEISALGDLEPPFDQVFNVEQMRQDRILHWLMRTAKPDPGELEELAKSHVVLLGDAAHATPILGGNGANEAIRDAIDLAEHIETSGVADLERFVRGRAHDWRQSVILSEENIREMH